MKYCFALLFFLLALLNQASAQKEWYAFDSSCEKYGRTFIGRAFTIEYYSKRFNFDDTTIANEPGTPLKNEEDVLRIAKPLLGKDKNGLQDEPYEIFLINGYWLIEGTLPTGWDGGTICIIFKAKNGKKVFAIHGQ